MKVGFSMRPIARQLFTVLLVTSSVLEWPFLSTGAESTSGRRPAAGPVTFNRDVAPILFKNCAPCHRPGESGPFSLLTFADASKRADTLVEVVERRYMPPWLPATGHVEFVGNRRLSDSDVAVFRRWLEGGLREGDPSDLPEAPKWSSEWELGEPDLILRVDTPFTLPPDGRNVYRNFVLPIPSGTNRFVRAFQFRPGSRAVHHAFILVDKSGGSRARDAVDSVAGFPGLDLPEGIESPGGNFLSWQPGRRPYVAPLGLSWTLPGGADLVFQLHLQPTGRPEQIAPMIGLYFTNRPPDREFFKICLSSLLIDIPAGEKAYQVEDSFVLPADVSVLGLNPHCHYLGKDLQGFAVLPNGTTNQLLHIPEWDFNWQGDYRLKDPLSLPRGSKLVMRYTFDNSPDNPRNPNRPPQRIRFGVETQDEMAELWVQLLPRNPADLEALRAAYVPKVLGETITYHEYRLRLDPNDAYAHRRLGEAKFVMGDLVAAAAHLNSAVRLDPKDDTAQLNLGLLYQEQKNIPAAEQALTEAIRLNPANGRAHGSLGIILGERGDLKGAALHLREAVRLDPTDTIARSVLEQIAQLQRRAAQPKK